MLRNNGKRKIRGFTMPELLLGLVVAGIGIAATVAAYVTLSQSWQDDLVTNELSRNANIAIERMLHGVTENTGLLAARSILSPATGATGNFVTYEDFNGTTRRFYYSEGKICTESGSEILLNVDAAAFYNNGQALAITLALQKAAGSKKIHLLVETQVSPRN